MSSFSRRRALESLVVPVFSLIICCTFAGSAAAGTPRFVDERDRVVLHDNVNPLAQPQFEIGRTDFNLPMERMIFSLSLRADARAELERLLAQQHDPTSLLYHHWLTPEEFGARFGLRNQDLKLITNWLREHGFTIDEVAKGRGWINFSGTAGQVEEAFATEMHDYTVDGKLRHANAADPSMPRAFAGLVNGIVTLHDFPLHTNHGIVRPVSPEELAPDFTSGGSHYMGPADFATIYDLNSAYSAGTNGSGRTIAIVGRTDIQLADVQFFRSFFGLPANDPVFVHNGIDPGDVGGGEETEADLDVEWSGAVGRNATVKFVISKSTSATDGVNLSAQYIVNNNLADSMSTSFGQCESLLGSTQLAFYNSTWSQAAAQGITAFVSVGDSGAAGCNVGGSTAGSSVAISGLCSTPFNVCVGGTQLNDTANPSTYWSSTNNSITEASVLSYIPEIAWNESGNVAGGSGLWSTGGGASNTYAKPSWQVAPGVPSDAKRDVPDVSLTAAGHDGYLIIQGHTSANSGLGIVGGTSASSPSFAGLMSLIVQKTGERQGNANTVFYPLAASQYSGTGPVIFHDVTSGNNSVPGVTGFTCTPGYDLVTGLGSVDGAALINNWPTPGFTLGVTPRAISVMQGNAGSSTVITAVSGGFNSALALSASGQPSGVTVTFSPASIAAPGSGTSTATFSVGSTAAGTYPITITATGGSVIRTATVTLTVSAVSSFTLAASPTTVSVAPGSAGTSTISTAISGGFNDTIALSASGQPTGVIVSFSPSSIAAPGSGASTAIFTVAATMATGTYPITITATGGGLTRTATLTLTISTVASFVFAATPSTVLVTPGNVGNSTVLTAISGGFNNAVTLSASGQPAGVTVSFSPASIAAPGAGVSAATFTVDPSMAVGTYPITVTAIGGGVTRTTTITLIVSAVPSFTIAASPAAITVVQGSAGTSTISATISGGVFTGNISVWATGQPSGVSVAFSPTNIQPSTGATTATFTVSTAAATGTYLITLHGNSGSTGGGTRTTTVTLIIIPVPSYTLLAAPTALSVMRGSTGIATVSTTLSGGFNSAIALSATGQPTGVTVSFNPAVIAPPGAGSSTVAFSVGAATATGTYTITIASTTGTDGGTHTATLALTVLAVPSFILVASSATISVAQGNAGTSNINTTVSGGFYDSVALSASGQPAGVTVSFSPLYIAAQGAGSSTATFSVGGATATGTYPITVSGTGGGVTRATTVTLTVTAAPRYMFGVSPATLSIPQGSTGTSTLITAIAGGFNTYIDFWVYNVPSGVTVTVSPSRMAAPGAGIATATFSVATSTAPGTYPITLSAAGHNSGAQYATITLTVTQIQP